VYALHRLFDPRNFEYMRLPHYLHPSAGGEIKSDVRGHHDLGAVVVEGLEHPPAEGIRVVDRKARAPASMAKHAQFA
jgi:hypothetical protein